MCESRNLYLHVYNYSHKHYYVTVVFMTRFLQSNINYIQPCGHSGSLNKTFCVHLFKGSCFMNSRAYCINMTTHSFHRNEFLTLNSNRFTLTPHVKYMIDERYTSCIMFVLFNRILWFVELNENYKVLL